MVKRPPRSVLELKLFDLLPVIDNILLHGSPSRVFFKYLDWMYCIYYHLYHRITLA